MKIAFVQDVNTFSVTIGTAIIAGVLRDKGHEVGLFVDENQIESAINKKTKAISVPNLLGNLPNRPLIYKIAKKHNLLIIEDSADTLGATINNFSSVVTVTLKFFK